MRHGYSRGCREDPPWRIKARKLFGTTSQEDEGGEAEGWEGGGKRRRNYDARNVTKNKSSREVIASPSNDYSPNNSLDFLSRREENKNLGENLFSRAQRRRRQPRWKAIKLSPDLFPA